MAKPDWKQKKQHTKKKQKTEELTGDASEPSLVKEAAKQEKKRKLERQIPRTGADVDDEVGAERMRERKQKKKLTKKQEMKKARANSEVQAVAVVRDSPSESREKGETSKKIKKKRTKTKAVDEGAQDASQPPKTKLKKSSNKRAERAEQAADSREPPSKKRQTPFFEERRKSSSSKENKSGKEERKSPSSKEKTSGKKKDQPRVDDEQVSLEDAIKLELSRWEVMDELVQCYDEEVSPVLGGGSSGRNDQKRKRHLEAWLWARSFHPLLPLGKPKKDAVTQGDSALVQKLTNAGLTEKDARSRVQHLASILASSPETRCSSEDSSKSLTAALEVRVEGTSRTLTLAGRSVSINNSHWSKLKELYTGREEDFEASVFLLLARYRVLQVHPKGGGNQGSISLTIWNEIGTFAKLLQEKSEAESGVAAQVIEAFASPLNTLARRGNYHSAFPDVDAAFGSRGSFFEADFKSGVVELNPPFDEDLVLRVAQRCDACLEAASAEKRDLVFVVIIPETDWAGHSAFKASRFMRTQRTALAGSHFYLVGGQHCNAQQCYPASRNTSIFVLASRPVPGMSRLADKIQTYFKFKPA